MLIEVDLLCPLQLRREIRRLLLQLADNGGWLRPFFEDFASVDVQFLGLVVVAADFGGNAFSIRQVQLNLAA